MSVPKREKTKVNEETVTFFSPNIFSSFSSHGIKTLNTDRKKKGKKKTAFLSSEEEEEDLIRLLSEREETFERCYCFSLVDDDSHFRRFRRFRRRRLW